MAAQRESQPVSAKEELRPWPLRTGPEHSMLGGPTPSSTSPQSHCLPGQLWARPNNERRLSPLLPERPQKNGSIPPKQALRSLHLQKEADARSAGAAPGSHRHGWDPRTGSIPRCCSPEGLRTEPPSYPGPGWGGSVPNRPLQKTPSRANPEWPASLQHGSAAGNPSHRAAARA